MHKAFVVKMGPLLNRCQTTLDLCVRGSDNAHGLVHPRQKARQCKATANGYTTLPEWPGLSRSSFSTFGRPAQKPLGNSWSACFRNTTVQALCGHAAGPRNLPRKPNQFADAQGSLLWSMHKKILGSAADHERGDSSAGHWGTWAQNAHCACTSRVKDRETLTHEIRRGPQAELNKAAQTHTNDGLSTNCRLALVLFRVPPYRNAVIGFHACYLLMMPIVHFAARHWEGGTW